MSKNKPERDFIPKDKWYLCADEIRTRIVVIKDYINLHGEKVCSRGDTGSVASNDRGILSIHFDDWCNTAIAHKRKILEVPMGYVSSCALVSMIKNDVFLGYSVPKLSMIEGWEHDAIKGESLGKTDEGTPFFGARTLYAPSPCRPSTVIQVLIDYLGSPAWINEQFENRED